MSAAGAYMIGAVFAACVVVCAVGYGEAHAAALPSSIEACESDTECEAAAASLCASGASEWCEESK